MKKKSKFKAILIGAALCYMGYIILSQQIMINRIKKDIEKYTAESKRLEESNSYLRDQIQYAGTDEYKERMARERIGLIKPGETVYVIEGQEEEQGD